MGLLSAVGESPYHDAMADEVHRDAALRAALDRHARAFSTYEQTIADSMARSHAVHERNTVAFDRNTAAFERNTAAFERHARAGGQLIGALKAIKASLDEMNADIVAQREGFMRLIDRLDDGGQQQA